MKLSHNRSSDWVCNEPDLRWGCSTRLKIYLPWPVSSIIFSNMSTQTPAEGWNIFFPFSSRLITGNYVTTSYFIIKNWASFVARMCKIGLRRLLTSYGGATISWKHNPTALNGMCYWRRKHLVILAHHLTRPNTVIWYILIFQILFQVETCGWW